MTSAPMNDEASSDLQLTKHEPQIPNSVTADAIIDNFLIPKTSPTAPAPAPFTPSPSSSGKRKRLKPDRYQIPSIKKKHSSSKPKPKVVPVHDPSATSLSLGKKKTAIKIAIRAPVQMSPTMIQAKEVRSSLGNDYPTFMKTMLKSHVTTCFWMGLPIPFCKSFLPKQDSSMVVEDENGEQTILKFIAYKFGLSAGWRGFAIAHKLREGDVLVFQLVESCKFKIYIVRANDSKEVDGALSVINQDSHKEHITPEPLKKYAKSKGRKPSIPTGIPLTMVQKKRKRSKPQTQVSSSHLIEHSGVNSEVQGPNLSIQKVKTFKDFHIMVNNQCIDSELSEEIRKNYYNLCMLKNEILHDGVRDGLYFKLVAGMIGETVSIANAIKNCKLATSKEEFDVWDSSLKYFELIGMKVGFLRDRIRLLTSLATEYEDAKRYVEAKEEHNRNTNEIMNLEAKLVELYESNRKIDAVVGNLKGKAERYEIEFKKKVDAPL